MEKKKSYGNESITALKGAERVRQVGLAVIFGSDGLDGCQHAVFEILSNAIDEAREGYGNLIVVTRFEDRSHRDRGLWPGLPGGLERGRAALQLGAGLLRDVCRRQISERRGR